jgi:hypothetical protein
MVLSGCRVTGLGSGELLMDSFELFRTWAERLVATNRHEHETTADMELGLT